MGREKFYWLAIVVIYISTRLPLLDVPLDRDEGAFALMAQSILDGKLPYQDIYDHKPPGVFYIYALSLLLLPATVSGIHLFLHIWNFGSLLLVNSIASNLFRGSAGLFAALIFAFLSGAPSTQGFSASTENFLLLPMLGSIALLLRSCGSQPGRDRYLLLLSGALGAASCWIKPVAFFPLLIVPLIIAGLNRGDTPGRVIRRFSWWLSGGLLLSFMVTLPFLLKGVGGEFYYWSFKHNMLYSAQSWSGEIAKKMFSLQLPRLMPDFAIPGFLALLAIITALIQRSKNGLMASLLLLLSIAGAAFSGYFYNHYFSIMTPAFSILAAFFITSISGRGYFSNHQARYGISAALLFITLTLTLRPWYWLKPDPELISKRVLGRNSFEAAPLIAGYLKERVSPDHYIYIDGSEPQIAFLAGRRNASPFVMAYPLTKPWERNREFQQMAWDSIESLKPKYIVVSWITTTSSSDIVDPFLEKKLANLVDNNYQFDSVILENHGGGHLIRQGPLSKRELAGLTPDIRFVLWKKNKCRGC